MRSHHIQCLVLVLLLAFGCGRKPQSPAASGTEQEKQRWIAQGWSYVEAFGTPSDDATYASHMSSPTARSVTAFASAAGGRTNKVYEQTSTLYLVVTMQRPSGDTFTLVFSKPK
jgi:hypothetical protein